MGAPGVSAYYISGGIYGGNSLSAPKLTVAGAYSIECPAAVSHYSGNAWGVAWTTFDSFYGGTEACEFFGFPATVTASGGQSLTITSGPSSGLYQGTLSIPMSTTTTYDVPIAGCTVTVSGPQTLAHGAGGNVVTAWNTTPTGMLVAIAVGNVDFVASGCPFASGSSGEFSLSFHAPGVTIT